MTPKDTSAGASHNNRPSAKRDRSWSLLMVGDHGQIIPFRRVKGIAIALTTLATLSILAAVGLGFWGGWLRVQNAGLQSELKSVQEAVRHLKDEKDLLMAKVVILETRSQKAGPAVSRDTDASGVAATTSAAKAIPHKQGQAEPKQPEKTADTEPKQTQKKTPATKKPPATASQKVPKTPTTMVTVNAFIADHRPSNNALSARFQIKNVGARGQRVSGRCVLVLKNAAKSDMEWVSVPHVSLIDGRPNGKQGRIFRIANFMTLKMQTKRVPDNFAFDTGTLYVFNDTGKQLLEKEVPVQLSYRKPPPAPEPAPQPAATKPRVESPQAAPAGAAQPQAPAPAKRPASGGVTPSQGMASPEAPALPKPEASLPPAAPVAPAPSTINPPPAPVPTQVPEVTPPAPADASNDPSLMTGSEAAPPTIPPEPTPEDTR